MYLGTQWMIELASFIHSDTSSSFSIVVVIPIVVELKAGEV